MRGTPSLEVLMDYKNIAQEILKWSHEVVETPLEAFGGLPACPFAREAWARSNVLMHVVYELDPVVEIKAQSDPSDPLVHIMAWVDYESMNPDEFNAWLDEQNKNHFGIWLMGFHPDSDENTMTPELEGIVEDDYAVILVQSLDHLVRASDKLRKTGYYKAFSQEDMEYIDNRRDVYNAWNEKVSQKKASFLNKKEKEMMI